MLANQLLPEKIPVARSPAASPAAADAPTLDQVVESSRDGFLQEYLFVKLGCDTAEDATDEVCPLFVHRSPRLDR